MLRFLIGNRWAIIPDCPHNILHMKIILLYTTFICLIISVESYGEIRYVKDKTSLLPVSFATIKVLNSAKGTIASEDGKFKLQVNSSDSIMISSAGYITLLIIGYELDSIVYLKPKIDVLKEVIVSSSTLIGSVVLGNGSNYLNSEIKCKNFAPGSTTDCWPWRLSTNQAEFAEKITVPEKKYIYRLNKVYIPAIKFECWEPLFLRLYSEDIFAGLPGDELFSKPIYITKNMIKKGKIVIDLSTENLIINEGLSFFVSIGWLPDENYKECKTLTVLFKSNNANTFSRNLSSSKYQWQKEWMISKSKNDEALLRNTFFAVQLDILK